MSYFNRWDVVDAHYWFCVHNHAGQESALYSRLCRISRYYTPSPLANGPAGENAREIYDALARRVWYACGPIGSDFGTVTQKEEETLQWTHSRSGEPSRLPIR